MTAYERQMTYVQVSGRLRMGLWMVLAFAIGALLSMIAGEVVRACAQ